MNSKIAIFAEGQAELIFVRNMLYKWFDFNTYRIAFRCIELNKGLTLDASVNVPYSIGNMEQAEFAYLIVNVGNDESVLSSIRKNADRLKNKGYSKIIGLRDMYCDKYHEACKTRIISNELNQKFVDGANDAIHDLGLEDFVFHHFAIMEIEAWVLSFRKIHQKYGIDVDREKIETELYHPTNKLTEALRAKGEKYGKHGHEIESLMGNIDKEDFAELRDSNYSKSFSEFFKSIVS